MFVLNHVRNNACKARVLDGVCRCRGRRFFNSDRHRLFARRPHIIMQRRMNVISRRVQAKFLVPAIN